MNATEMFGIITPIIVGWGAILWRISRLEGKIDRYNNLGTRLKDCEDDMKSLKQVCPLCTKEDM